jgi:hypothetical protein
MDAIANPEEPFSDDDYDDLEEKRSIIRQSLDEIAADVGIALLKANLTFPLGLTVPSSGHAFITMVTHVDPSNDDWERASAIVRQIVSKKLGGIRLRNRHLPCAIVNVTKSSADTTANALDFDTQS